MRSISLFFLSKSVRREGRIVYGLEYSPQTQCFAYNTPILITTNFEKHGLEWSVLGKLHDFEAP